MILQGTSPLSVVQEIEQQQDAAGLVQASLKVTQIIGLLLKEGARAANITPVVTEINDRIVGRVLEFAERRFGPAPLRYAWLALGSEGRREQVFRTDQDNVLLLDDCTDPELAAAGQRWAAELGAFAKEALIACGFPPCPAGIMAANPLWCQPLRVWRKYFSDWIQNPGDTQRIKALAPARVSALPCLLDRFKVPRWRSATIRRAVEEADIIHLMGHWSVLNAMVYVAARRARKPYVICPAGALPLFGRSRWLKRFYNLVIGNAIVRNASGWIAVTEAEFPQFEGYGVPRSRVTVIPNGVSAEDFPDVDVAEIRHRNGLPDAPTILFMGRLNPIKGPDLLLRAFLHAREAFPQHHLVFAGPDGGILASLRETAEQSGAGGMVHFIGYVGGADKSAAYRMADLLVVPSRQEAMSIVAIEAGICGVRVLLTDQCGFGEIRAIDERLEVPATESGIADGLARLLSESGVLEKLSPAWSSFFER